MTNRVKWIEHISGAGCGWIEDVMFSRSDGFGVVRGERDRIECDVSGFETEALDEGFRFRCVQCNKIARLLK
jgi:hypothetical protein